MGIGCLGVGCVDLCIEWLLGMHWAGNGGGFSGSQGEPLICYFSGIVTEGFTIPETVF